MVCHKASRLGVAALRSARERVLPALCSLFFVWAPLLPGDEKPDTLSERALLSLLFTA